MTTKESKLTALEQAEMQVWRDALLRHQGSIRRACRELKKSWPTGLRKVRKYGLKHLTQNNQKYGWSHKV